MHERHLSIYLLGQVEYSAWLMLQRRLVYELAEDRRQGILVLCEHPATISVGRLGSRLHIRPSEIELSARGWPVRWVNRGAGCLLHSPGQLAIYPIIALDERGWNPFTYLHELHSWLADMLSVYPLTIQRRDDASGLWVGDRQLAHFGIAIRQWISYFGWALNVQPDLELFREVACDGATTAMTSLERELRTTMRIAGLRQRVIETFTERFGFDHWSLFHSHPALDGKATSNAIAHRTR